MRSQGTSSLRRPNPSQERVKKPLAWIRATGSVWGHHALLCREQVPTVPCALRLVPCTKWSPFHCLLSSSQGDTMFASCPVSANQLKPTNEGKLLVTFTHNKAGLHTRVKHTPEKQGAQIVSLHFWVWLTSASLCFRHSVLPLKTCFLCPSTCKPGRLHQDHETEASGSLTCRASSKHVFYLILYFVCVHVYVCACGSEYMCTYMCPKRTPVVYMLLESESGPTHDACVTIAYTLHASHTYRLGYVGPNLSGPHTWSLKEVG